MSNTDKNTDFLDLLTALTESETFDLLLTDNKNYKFKQLTTNNLKQLIKTVVDSPLTRAKFNITLTEIMKESLVDSGVDFDLLNIVDRLLFCIETRIQSISPTIVLSGIEVDLREVKKDLDGVFQKNPDLFKTQVLTKDQTVITYGIPFIKADAQLNDYIHKSKTIKIENTEDLRNVLGEAFLNEIAKTLYSITIKDTPMDLLTVDFATRIKMIEKLPAHFIQEILTFIEKYKSLLDICLETKAGANLTIDGSLFSIR
jgi:hypothetical protein